MKVLKDAGYEKKTIEMLKAEGFDNSRNIGILNSDQINTLLPQNQSQNSQVLHNVIDSDRQRHASWKLASASPKLLIPTGVPALDEMLGGSGLKSGQSYLFYGEFKTGKSQIAHQLIITALRANPIKKNDKVIFIDTEGTFRPERIANICDGLEYKAESIMEKVKVFKITKIEDFQLIAPSIQKICEDNRVKLIIVDSLMHHFRLELSDTKKPFYEILKIIKNVLKEFRSLAETFDFPLYYTSPIASTYKESYYSVRPILPNVLGYFIDNWVLLSINDQIPDVEDRVVRNAVVVKSTYLPERSAEFVIEKEGVREFC